MDIEDNRKTLLEYFRSQINLHAQIAASLVVVIFAQGIFTYSIPINNEASIQFLSPNTWGDWKIAVIFFGVGFIGSLMFIEWWKVYWYSRLWNSALVAVPRSIREVFDKHSSSALVKETGISKLVLGATELFCKACSRGEATWIYISKHMKSELSFCILCGFLVGSATSFLKKLVMLGFPMEVAFGIAVILLIALVLWVRQSKSRETQRYKWLISQDLDRLADVVDN